MKKNEVESPAMINGTLPYPDVSYASIASRDEVRMLATRRGRETIMFPFASIKLREGFNTRKVYNGIVELAEMIKAQGLITPLTVDVLKSGDALVEQGNRRWMALKMLWDKGWLKTAEMQGISQGSIEVFRNDKEVSEVDRIKRIISSNHSEPLTAYEIADTIGRLKNYFQMPVKEISKIVGYSRQQVENMLILANEPTEVKEAVAQGILKPTTAIALARTKATTEQKVEIVKEAKEKGEVVKLKDIPSELQVEVEEKQHQEEEDLPAEVQVNLAYVEDPELKSHTTSAKASPQQSMEAHDKTLNTMKDEEIFCSETIQMLDKMSLIADKIMTKHGEDLRRLIPGCIQRVTSVRDYVKKIRD